MLIVSCQQLKKYYGANLILEQVDLEAHENDRIGLIGRNGCGKSTLLQMIAGLSQPDGGLLTIRKGVRIGYLAQIPSGYEGLTVYQTLAEGYREATDCRARMKELEARMSEPDAAENDTVLQDLLKQYAGLQERFEQEGGYEMETRIRQVAYGLGIGSDQWERPYSSLSGGEKTKVGLAALLIEKPSLLLLDEPTNHLDLQGVEWLENYLNDYQGTCLIVSHDRYFLDRVVTKVIELEDGEAFSYLTNYSGYVMEKEERLLQQFADYQEQQKQIRKMKETIKQLTEWGRLGGNEKFFRRAASMQKALDRMEKLKRPVLERKSADFEWKRQERSGREALVLEGVRKSFGGRTVLEHAEGLLEYGDKIALVGRNGSGKTTLFKLVLGELTPDEGALRIGSRVKLGYLAQEEKPADRNENVLDHFRKEAGLEEGEARGRLAKYLFYGSDVFKPVCRLSGGEWTRLRLALLVHSMPNLLLLDEPTNHLDIASRESLEENLEEFPGTVLAISHDRYFINKLASRVWELQDGRLRTFIGGFDDYRDKRKQLELALEAEHEAERPPAPKPAARPGTAADGKTAKRDEAMHEKARKQLEQSIQAEEEHLRSLDIRLEETGLASDADELALVWTAREESQARLNRLYEQWMDMDELI